VTFNPPGAGPVLGLYPARNGLRPGFGAGTGNPSPQTTSEPFDAILHVKQADEQWCGVADYQD